MTKKQKAEDVVRRCAVTGEMLEKKHMIRFVLSPDGAAICDLRHKLPGKGVWIKAEREALSKALSAGFFSKACRRTVKNVPAVDDVEALVRQAALGWIGLANKSGDAVQGFEKVKELLKAKAVKVLIVAKDGSQNTLNKLHSLIQETEIVTLFPQDELGGVFGREAAVVIGLKPGGIAERFMQQAGMLERLV